MESKDPSANRPSSSSLVVKVGVALMVALRLLGELAGCSNISRNTPRVIHSIEAIGETAGESRNITRAIEGLSEDSRTIPGIKGGSSAIDDVDNIGNTHMQTGVDGTEHIIPHIPSNSDDEGQFLYRNIQFLQDYNFNNTSMWIPFHPSETITKYQIPYQAFTAPTKNYKIISIIPDSDDAFQNIFKFTMTPAAKQEMEHYSALFKALDNSDVAGNIDYSEANLLNYISANPDTGPIIIIGHSEKINIDRSIILPNGDSVSIDLIHKTCAAHHSQCLVLTCYSDDFKLNGTISLKDAYYMTRRGVDMLELIKYEPKLMPQKISAALANGSLTDTELIIESMRSERIVRKAGKISICGIVSAGVTYKVISTYSE